MLRGLWSNVASWWTWMFSGIPRAAPVAQNTAFPFDATMRMAMTQAESMHQMLLKMAEFFIQICKAHQAFAEQGWTMYAPSGSTAAPPTPASPSTARPGAPVDVEQLKQLLQTMDPIQAAQVLHAVQLVQAMDYVHRRQAAGTPVW